MPSKCSPGVIALIVLARGCFPTAALAEPVRLHVHVTQESDNHNLGGAYLRLVCPSADVDITTRTGLDGWGLLEFGYESTPADLSNTGPLRLSPTVRPNPVYGEGEVPFVRPAGKSGDDGDLTLYDLRGRVVARGRLGAASLEISGGGAPPGVYVLRCVDQADGSRSDCRIVASGAPLRRLRLVSNGAAVARRDPPVGLPGVLTIRYPGDLDQEIAMVLVPGDQDLEVALVSVGGSWPVQTWLFASDHGWNTAAVDSGWVPVVADTALVFDHRIVDTDGTRHALAQWNAAQPTREFCDDDILPGRTSATLVYSPPIVPVIYFDVSDIPPGATVESAWLIVSPSPWSRIPCAPGAAHAATLDIWNADAGWLQAPVSETCGSYPGSEHWRRTSWQFADVAHGIPWDPPLSVRQTWDEFGIHSQRVTHEVPGGHACRYDVTRALQAWSDNRNTLANAGFALSNWSPSASYTVAAGPGAAAAGLQPLLVVSVSERPHTVSWNGHPLAFSFATDDGDTANLRYAEICEAHGVRMTAFIMRKSVREFTNNNLSKVTASQWRDLASRGHEIGHHSDHHLYLWGLAEITWGNVDSMHVELARDTWLEEVFDDGQTAAAIDILAYPSGGVSLWAIKNLVNHDFIFGRCAAGREYWGLPAWGHSGWTTYLSWYDPVNLFNVAILNHPELVGYYKTDDYDYDTIRLNVRRWTATMLNQGQAALLTFCHSTKASPYQYGIDYDELDWILTAVQESGLYWIGTHGELAHCYRDAHLPVAPGDGLGHAAYDSLVSEGHQEFTNVWWILPGPAGR